MFRSTNIGQTLLHYQNLKQMRVQKIGIFHYQILHLMDLWTFVKCNAKPYSSLVTDTTFPSDNILR